MAERRLKILHLLSYHLTTGSAEPVLNLAAAQRAAGHDARIACDTIREGDLDQCAEARAIPVDRRLALYTKSGPILLLRDILALKRMWRETEMDIFHVHGSHDHTLVVLAKIPRGKSRLVRTLHTEKSLGKGREWQLKRADGLVVVARRFRERLIERDLLPEEQIVAVEGAVDCTRFQPGPGGEAVRSQAGVDFDVPAAGIVARMKPGRQHHMLLEAWVRVVSRLPQARLLLIGRGELDEELRSFVARSSWGKTVVFLGYRRDLPQVYRALDLKVLLAPGNDGTCRAALEAMACGVPVLASDGGALGEIVRDGQTGRVIPRNDRDALAETLFDLLSDRKRLGQMGSCAREEALQRFTIERQAEKIEQLYIRVLASAGWS